MIVDSLPDTERGDKAFGSTGVSQDTNTILERKTIAIKAQSIAAIKWANQIASPGKLDEQ